MKPTFLIPVFLFCIGTFGLLAGNTLAQGFGFGERGSSITNDTANNFFENCTKKTDPMMTGDSQMEMCACMAVQLQSSMTFEEYEQIKEEPVPGSEVYAKYLIYVHGPCLEYPVKDYIKSTCLKNKSYQGYSPDIEGLCRCTSDKMARYAGLYAPDMLLATFKNNPHYEDAMTPLLENADFMTEQRTVVQECLKNQNWDTK